MTNATASQPSKPSRKWIGYIASGLVIFVLAIVSLCSTFAIGEGAFPDGEFHLQIKDLAGKPIQGAVLNIYKGGGKEHAFGFPFYNYSSENSLVSNVDGEIIVTHIARGMEFGGPILRLFWIIPIGSETPRFTCQVTAEGYRPYRFSSEQLFKIARDAHDDDQVEPMNTIQVDGIDFRIKTFEKLIVLKEK